MSWHGKWRPGDPDPFSKPAKAGDTFGCFVVVRLAVPDAHYGLRAIVRCSACGHERTSVLAQLRHNPPKTHRGCSTGQVSP